MTDSPTNAASGRLRGSDDDTAVSRILIVEDDPDQRRLLRRRFEAAGHVVDEAEHGAHAVVRVKETCPDLLVTDMDMPVMAGHELIRWIRANTATANLPILVVSGDSHLAAGADLTLAKPYRLAELLRAASALLAHRE